MRVRAAEAEPFLAIRGEVDTVAAAGQAVGHLTCRFRIVLDHQDAPYRC